MPGIASHHPELIRLSEYTRTLHRLRREAEDDQIDREFDAICRAVWGYTLDDIDDDDFSVADHAWLDGLTEATAAAFAAAHGYDLADHVHGGWVSDWWGFAWMILAEVRGLLTPEHRVATWRKHDARLLAKANIIGVIRGRA